VGDVVRVPVTQTRVVRVRTGQMGLPGGTVELGRTATDLVWRVRGTDEWLTLVALADLAGAAGESPALRVDGGMVQWKLPADLVWTDLVSVEDLSGADGREVQLGTSASHIVWRYEGDVEWADLVPLSLLAGADGREVELGVSASHVRWRLADGAWADLVALDVLRGADGAAVSLQSTATHLQWRLGDGPWTDLFAIADLPAGPAGRAVLNGSGAPSGALGADGDFYIDTAEWWLYGPRTAGAWGAGVSLVGPAGSGGGLATYADAAAINAVTAAEQGVAYLPDVAVLIPGLDAGIGSTVLVESFMTNGGYGGDAPESPSSFAPLVQEVAFFQGTDPMRYRRFRYWDGSTWGAWYGWERIEVNPALHPQGKINNYTIVAGDRDYLLTMNNGVARTFTLPADGGFPVGGRVHLMRLGAGSVTVVAGAGATLRNPHASGELRAQYSVVTATKIAASTWALEGDLVRSAPAGSADNPHTSPDAPRNSALARNWYLCATQPTTWLPPDRWDMT
jgi:hypothetical protein